MKRKHGDGTQEEDAKNIPGALHESGTLSPGEAELVEHILSFRETEAQDIMTHRSDIEALDGNTALEDAFPELLKSDKSCFPVYEEELDSVLGILNFRDAARIFIGQPELRKRSLEEIPGLIREAPMVPETRQIENLFQYMKARKTRMVLVIDEYGQVSGLLTMEDILEEIVGDVLDEYDGTDQGTRPGDDNSIVMDGMTPLERAGEVLGFDFGGEQFETLSGYLTSLLGHVPTEEDREVKGKKYLFHILKTENHTIRKVRAELLHDQPHEEKTDQ